MPRRRNRRGDAANRSQPRPPLATPVPPASPVPPSPTVGADRRIDVVPPLSDAFRSIFERAADRARSDLASTGKVGTTAFFVYTNGTMKVVSFSFKGELQNDGLIRRIREKALTENASAVLVLTEVEHDRQRITVLSGVTPGTSASARLDYGFDKKTKTVTSWKMSWLEKPVLNVLLDGIFDKTG
jgi:hypothetical protein